MKCEHCGKELKKIGELTESNIRDLELINNKISTSNQALDINTIKDLPFSKPEEIFYYFKAAFDEKADAEFLKWELIHSIAERINYKGSPYDLYFPSYTYDENGIYVHP